MNQYYNPNNEEDYKSFEMTGNSLELKKEEVLNLTHQLHLNIFENNSGKSNKEEYENKVNSILNNANSEAGKIGRNSLSKDNKFVIMVKAGSKGSDINLSQMISGVGQQNVDSKRIPYGFEDRTLPHFKKFDDSPEARGFVENSFIQGLSPAELYFHAMGGRTGLIDTAVKTSETGYIQRKLIKSMEDMKVLTDYSVRTCNGTIIQFLYGDDGFEPVKIEKQVLPYLTMKFNDIIEKYKFVGGICLHAGTIPSKTFREAILSKVSKNKKIHRYAGYSFQKFFKRVQKIVNDEVNVNNDQLSRNGIKVIYGEASFKNKNEIIIKSGKNTREIKSEFFLISVGNNL